MSVATLASAVATPDLSLSVLDLTPASVLVVCLSDDDEIDAVRTAVADLP